MSRDRIAKGKGAYMEKPTSVVDGPEVYWTVIEPSGVSDNCSDSSRGHTGGCTALLGAAATRLDC